MPDLILHHFDWSPFAEKARLALGLKGLTWHSVQIPMIMPRPDLMPLTGGYRKTPTLQIGADVYCDTRMIARELEQRFPTPSLFPDGDAGLALALSHWSDTSFYEPGAALSMGINKDVPAAVIADRKQVLSFIDFDRLSSDAPHLLSQFRANAQLMEQQLSDGRTFLLGGTPGWADINAYFPVWMARIFIPEAAEVFAPFARLANWEARVEAIGHGTQLEMESTAALEVARAATPLGGSGVDLADPLAKSLRLAVGEPVSVAPADYAKVPVVGKLVTLQIHEVAIRREDPRVGGVVTHFPRIGYRVERA